MLLAEVRVISKKIKLHVIDIEEISDELKSQIETDLVEICEGDSDTDIEITKANFHQFLSTKDQRTQYGAVAEFFIHLYLRQQGFKQEFLFLNLEEGSIKKGFDGYFSNENEEYLVESKSGGSRTAKISHKNKLKKAFDDISGVIAGDSKKSSNNPWRNAYNHASHADVGAEKSIRKKIKIISDLYDQGTFQQVSSFNVIPCSTIFLEDESDFSFSEAILNENADFFKNLSAKTTNFLCVTKSTFLSFIDYLGGSHG